MHLDSGGMSGGPVSVGGEPNWTGARYKHTDPVSRAGQRRRPVRCRSRPHCEAESRKLQVQMRISERSVRSLRCTRLEGRRYQPELATCVRLDLAMRLEIQLYGLPSRGHMFSRVGRQGLIERPSDRCTKGEFEIQ